MPFAKGNKLWAKGLEVRKENKQKPNDYMRIFIDGSFERYIQLMEKLQGNQEITKEEREFMDRLEKSFDFNYQRLSRSTLSGDPDAPLFDPNSHAAKLAKNLSGTLPKVQVDTKDDTGESTA